MLRAAVARPFALAGGTAGFDVIDLDKELEDTPSADLLATLGDHRRLIEVKSQGATPANRLPPADRSPTVYTRHEFVATLAEPVIAVPDLFDWWRTEDWTTLQRAVLN